MKKFNAVNTELLAAINLIEASAGTGKTYVIAMLVLRFVVEKDLAIKQILVVTFTNAATEELKDRIRKRLLEARQIFLANQAGNDATDTDKNIKLWLAGLKIESQVIMQRLNNALLDIDQANIFTIHGFCQHTLSKYALESGQLFDAELTADSDTIKQLCADDFWRKQVYQRTAWEALLLTEKYKTPEQLLNSVNFIAPDLKVLPDYVDLEQGFNEFKKQLKSNKSLIIPALKLIEDELKEGKFKTDFSHNFSHIKQSIIDYLDENSACVPNFSVFTQQGLHDALNGHKFRKSQAKPLPSEAQKQLYIEALDCDFTPFEVLDSGIKKISLIFRRSLLETLREQVDKRLAQLNLLSFDHLITALVDCLSGEQARTLSRGIQQDYQVALLDEFQDTDASQWFIFSTLFNHPKHYLYLVGDPKQAIYKFRGADIHSYFAAQAQAQHHFTLTDNWRSHPQLVIAINTLFSKNQPFFSQRPEFTPANAALSSQQGVLVKDEQELPPLVLWQLDNGENQFFSAGKASNEIKTAVVNEIVCLLSDQYYIKRSLGKEKVLAKDIAILLRSHAQAKQFQLALNEAGVVAVINSKESVFASVEADELFILLQAIAQPGNITLLKQALTLVFFKLDGQQLFQILNDEKVLTGWVLRFQNYQQLWQKKGLMAMMQNLLATEKVRVNLAQKRQAERRITNLQHCIELVQQQVIEAHLEINKTLDYLRKQIRQATEKQTSSDEQQLRLESDEAAVRINTMHSSKGLEYDIVFCPFLWQRNSRLKQESESIKCYKKSEMVVDLGSENFAKHRALALDEELAEDLRVLYVTVTRAKYRCYISWADVRSKDQANQSAMAYLLDFATTDFAQQQSILQNLCRHQPAAFCYRLLDAEQTISRTWQSKKSLLKLSYQTRRRILYTDWQMSSYTALAALSVAEVVEIPADKAREESSLQEIDRDYTELPAGAQTGNVIHDLLENIAFKTLSQADDISLQREQSCLHYGVKTETPHLFDILLRNTVNTVLSTEHTRFSLKDLEEQTCVKEMPFYLAMNSINVKQLNLILQDSPTFQPLSEKKMSGYLTGFIDLVCEYEGQYFVMDYKSNSLKNYEQADLILAMREHNYGLQYWIYSLVLHLYLQQRISAYDYEQHFGGVKYLFVRGMDAKHENRGVFQTKPEKAMIDRLAGLFK